MEVSGGRLDDHRRRKRKCRGLSAILGAIELAPHSANAHDIIYFSPSAIRQINCDPNSGSPLIRLFNARERWPALEEFVVRKRALEDCREISEVLAVSKCLERE